VAGLPSKCKILVAHIPLWKKSTPAQFPGALIINILWSFSDIVYLFNRLHTGNQYVAMVIGQNNKNVTDGNYIPIYLYY